MADKNLPISNYYIDQKQNLQVLKNNACLNKSLLIDMMRNIHIFINFHSVNTRIGESKYSKVRQIGICNTFMHNTAIYCVRNMENFSLHSLIFTSVPQITSLFWVLWLGTSFPAPACPGVEGRAC